MGTAIGLAAEMFAVLARVISKGLGGGMAIQSLWGKLIPAYKSSSKASQYASPYSGADELYNNSHAEGGQSMVYRAPYMSAAHNAFCATLGVGKCPRSQDAIAN